MNSQGLKSNIKLYLSRFESLVRISSANNEYDIHNHAENFLIPFLKKIYGWELTNANVLDKNAEAIDLIDFKKQVAVQVSSNSKLDKVKITLQKFLTSKYKDDIKEVYFYFLLPKQKTYSSQSISKIIKNKIHFNTKTHILDNEVAYNAIKQIANIKKLRDIESFLRDEFTDLKITNNVTLEDYEAFKSKYKAACLSNYTRLNFFGLSIPNKPREVQLYSLFVKPNFGRDDKLIFNQRIFNHTFKTLTKVRGVQSIKYETVDTDLFTEIDESSAVRVADLSHRYYGSFSNSPKIPFQDLFNYGNHLVLLGNPGAGKSSLVKFSICKLLEEDYFVFSCKETYGFLPYRIELHKYNQFKKGGKGGFLEFIKHNLSDEFQIDTKPLILNEIIEKFPSLIFFDGLDEIFDIQERLQVRNDIQNFVKHNASIRSVVTSRYESYEEVKLDDQLFTLLEVNDFDNEQIAEYVEKWYKIEELNEKLRNQEIKDCIDQLQNVDSQLKHNPLLLSLILILYRNEQDLPTSKLEIYEGCAQTLVETRDKKEKKLALELKVPHKISVFSNLAFWQFTNESINKDFKIDYRSIKSFVTNYLIDKGEFEDRNEAEDAAIQFLEYAKLRSIYLENKFTHKTFYEYFTSHYIFSNYYSTPGQYEKFLKLLNDNVGLSAWAVILELLICQVDSSHLEYKVMDEIIQFLLSEKSYETCVLFSSVMPHLRTLSPLKARVLIATMVNYIVVKNNSKESRENLKEKLINLIKIKRFESTLGSEVEVILREESDRSFLVFDLILELFGTSKNRTFEKLIEENERFTTIDKEKHYIVKCFQLHDEKGNWDNFKQFLSLFGKKAALVTYTSNYNLPCFAGMKNFNWIFTLLFVTKNKSQLALAEQSLSELGITKTDIITAIKTSTHDIATQWYFLASTNSAIFKDTDYFDPIIKTLGLESEFVSTKKFKTRQIEY